MSILDRDIRPWDVAYTTFVSDAEEFDREVRQWYKDSHGGLDPALSDVHHGYWRVIQERDWWVTPRRALQDAWPMPVEPPEPGSTEKLKINGQFFMKESGERFTAKETTQFRLYKRFLEGEDISPIVAQVQSYGFNMVRVLGTCDYMFHLYPQEYSDRYYTSLGPFASYLSSFGIYLEFVVFADATRVMPNGNEQVNHWNRVVSSFQGVPNVIVELLMRMTHIDTNIFPRILGVILSHGSNGSQAHPVEPFWDYVTFHTNGAFEEQRKIGHNAWEIWGGPTLTNETSRYWEVGMWVGSSLDRQKTLAYDSAAGAALLCAGACYHTVNGKQSVLWTSNEGEVGKMWTSGMDSVPLEFQDGAYIRRDDLLAPDVLRAYERRLSDGRGHVVLIHK
jgi:hypothetical protein